MGAPPKTYRSQPVRLFKSDFLERFTKVHPRTPPLIYLPLIVLLIYLGRAQAGLSVPLMMGFVLLGLLSWSLTEYLMHRYLFHWEPKSRLGGHFVYLLHGVHHDCPHDPLRLVMPPVVSLPLAALFYGLFHLLLGAPHVWPFFAGYVGGYLVYDMTHYAIHHLPMRHGPALAVRNNHLRHHFRDDERNFGVSSPLWDYIFRTLPRSEGKGDAA